MSVFYALQTGLFPWVSGARRRGAAHLGSARALAHPHACARGRAAQAYWHLMLTGRWFGPRGIFEPRMKFVDTWAMP